MQKMLRKYRTMWDFEYWERIIFILKLLFNEAIIVCYKDLKNINQ